MADHTAHLLMLGGPVVVLGGLFAMLHLTRPDRTRVVSSAPLLLAMAWAGAAIVHLLVIRDHFAETAVLGVFFLVLTVVQLGYAAALLVRCSPQLLTAGLFINLSVVMLWAATRTAALPLVGHRESVGVADLTATGFEILAIVLTARALRRCGADLRKQVELVPLAGARTRASVAL